MEVHVVGDSDQNEQINPKTKKIYEINRELNKQRIGFLHF